jgi:crossover junction endodeoxyribonuclease RuvC
MRILGIDPGSNATGYGVLDQVTGRLVHVAHGVLRPPRTASTPARLATIHRTLSELIAIHRPAVAVVEQVFVAASPRSALVLGQARGVALAALAAAELSVVEYSPRQIKLAATGSGAAGKQDVQRMVQRLLGLERAPASDAADALAAALCHANAGPLGAAAREAASETGRWPVARRRPARFVTRRTP